MTKLPNLPLCSMLALFILWASIGIASGYEYWLDTDKARLAPGETVVIRLMFGEHFGLGSEKPLQLERTPIFRFYGDSRQFGNLLLPNSVKGGPVAMKKPESEGTMLVTMERSASEINFGRTKFVENAAKEGYNITEAQLPLTEKRVTETYSRYLKTIIQVGSVVNKVPQRTVGQTFEIVPKVNPFKAGLSQFRARVLFEGKPEAGLTVRAIQRLNGRLNEVSAITNSDGKCTLPISQKGSWLIRSVKISPDVSSPASYRSYWAALTFSYE